MLKTGDRVKLVKAYPGTGVETGEIGVVMDVYPYGCGTDWTLCETEFHPNGAREEICLSLFPSDLEKLEA